LVGKISESLLELKCYHRSLERTSCVVVASVVVEGIWRQFVDHFPSMVAAYIVVEDSLKNRVGSVRFIAAVENCCFLSF
jgi:hypothetical protein